MFACRSRSALARAKAAQRIQACPVLSRAKFSTVAPLRQAAHVEDAYSKDPGTRLPLALQALWYEPFRRAPTHGLPVCDLQIRAYSVRNLEFMCDFALRAAYYCCLPAAGPVPLPIETERWTVPRSHFIYKKSQENYERVTYKRLIQIKDGHPETVELWLAFLRKHQYYGVGMKANMFGFDELGVGKLMNISLETTKGTVRPLWSHFGSRKTFETAEKARELLESEEYKSLSHEDVLKEITEVEHFQKLAKTILENPKYQAYVKEQKSIVNDAEESVEESVVMEEVMMGEEKVQAKAVEEALEKVEEIGAPKAEEASKIEGVQATPEFRAEASAAEPVAREEVIPNLKRSHAEERKVFEARGKEVEERRTVLQTQEVSPSQIEKTLDKRPKGLDEREAPIIAAPTPIVKEIGIETVMNRLDALEGLMTMIRDREARLNEWEASLRNREKGLGEQKSNLDERGTVATLVETAPAEILTDATPPPVAETPTVEKMAAGGKLQAEAVEEAKAEGVLSEMTKTKEGVKEGTEVGAREVKIEEKPKEG